MKPDRAKGEHDDVPIYRRKDSEIYRCKAKARCVKHPSKSAPDQPDEDDMGFSISSDLLDHSHAFDSLDRLMKSRNATRGNGRFSVNIQATDENSVRLDFGDVFADSAQEVMDLIEELKGACPEWADAEFWIRDTEDENDLGMDLDEFCAKNALGEHQARG